MESVSTLVAHALAAGVVTVVTFVVTAVGYFGLLLWAVFAGELLGGPFALIAMLLTVVALVPPMILLLLLPATAAARWLRRAFHWSWWSEMPLATLAMVALVSVLYLALALTAQIDVSPRGAKVAGAVAGTMLLPLGLYWWSYTAADGVLRLVRAGCAYISRKFLARVRPGA